MRCLYCGKRLALLRKLTDSEFCSDGHRRLYQREQEQLAVARLSSPQKLQVSVDKAAPKGKPAVNGKPTPAVAANPDAEIKGFLDQQPAPRVYRGVRRPEATWITPETKSYLPELRCAVETATRVESTESPIAEPANPLAALQHLAWQPEPVLASRSSFGDHLDSIESPATPVTPVFLDFRLPEIALANKVPISGAVALGDRAKPPAAPLGATQPARFLGTVDLAPLADVLRTDPYEPIETTSAPAGITNPKPPRPSFQIYELPKPGFVDGGRRLQKTRPRELFFPIPRLSELPKLVSSVANRSSRMGDTCVLGRHQRAGIARMTWRVQATNSPGGKGVREFQEFAASPDKLRITPAVIPAFIGQPRLAESGRLEDVSLFLAGEVVNGATPLHTESLAAIAATTPPPQSPRLELARVYSLGSQEQIAADEIVHALAGPQQQHHAVGYDTRLQATPSRPAFQNVPAIPKLAADAQMRAIENPFIDGSTLAMRTVETGFVIEDKKAQASFPQSAISAGFQPSPSLKVVAVPLGNGLPYPTHTVAITSLEALHPEPELLLPQPRFGVEEDSEMREAVKAMSVLLKQQSGFSLPRFHLPQLRMGRADLKWFVMMVPALLLLSVYMLTGRKTGTDLASLPPASEATEIAGKNEPPAETKAEPPAEPKADMVEAKTENSPTAAPVVNANLSKTPEAPVEDGVMGRMQQTILRRAAISLSDDFRSGLAEWEGRGDWSKQWSYDSSGFLKTGPLILYKPSLQLTDYRMEFLGMIDKKSIGWVYRATDQENYYASKISIIKNGPLPVAVVERYAVIHGKVTSQQRRPLPLQVRTDSFYRVQVDVRGDGFTISVQGQVVDYWSDARLKAGGVGFFSAKGEQASLRWVEISHQRDFLGKLCAFLAPYSLPQKEGVTKQ